MVVLTAGLACALATPLMSQEPVIKRSAPLTYTGEIVDISCYKTKVRPLAASARHRCGDTMARDSPTRDRRQAGRRAGIDAQGAAFEQEMVFDRAENNGRPAGDRSQLQLALAERARSQQRGEVADHHQERDDASHNHPLCLPRLTLH